MTTPKQPEELDKILCICGHPSCDHDSDGSERCAVCMPKENEFCRWFVDAPVESDINHWLALEGKKRLNENTDDKIDILKDCIQNWKHGVFSDEEKMLIDIKEQVDASPGDSTKYQTEEETQKMFRMDADIRKLKIILSMIRLICEVKK